MRRAIKLLSKFHSRQNKKDLFCLYYEIKTRFLEERKFFGGEHGRDGSRTEKTRGLPES